MGNVHRFPTQMNIRGGPSILPYLSASDSRAPTFCSGSGPEPCVRHIPSPIRCLLVTSLGEGHRAPHIASLVLSVHMGPMPLCVGPSRRREFPSFRESPSGDERDARMVPAGLAPVRQCVPRQRLQGAAPGSDPTAQAVGEGARLTLRRIVDQDRAHGTLQYSLYARS